MARTEIPITVQLTNGDVVVGASVTIRKRSDNSLATVYSAETGGGTISNPLATDAYGRVTGYVDRGAYVANITGGTPPVVAYNEVFDSAPGGDGSVDALWIPDGLLEAVKLTAAARNNWLKLNTVADRKVNFGVLDDGLTWGSTPYHTYTIPHGLGVVPIMAVVSAEPLFTNNEPTIASLVSMDATNLIVNAKAADGAARNLPQVGIHWIAIA